MQLQCTSFTFRNNLAFYTFIAEIWKHALDIAGFILLYCLYAVIVVVGRYIRLKFELGDTNESGKFIFIYTHTHTLHNSNFEWTL